MIFIFLGVTFCLSKSQPKSIFLDGSHIHFLRLMDSSFNGLYLLQRATQTNDDLSWFGANLCCIHLVAKWIVNNQPWSLWVSFPCLSHNLLSKAISFFFHCQGILNLFHVFSCARSDPHLPVPVFFKIYKQKTIYLTRVQVVMKCEKKSFIELKGKWKLLQQLPHPFQKLQKHRWSLLPIWLKKPTPEWKGRFSNELAHQQQYWNIVLFILTSDGIGHNFNIL